jgi:hypothetical protein
MIIVCPMCRAKLDGDKASIGRQPIDGDFCVCPRCAIIIALHEDNGVIVGMFPCPCCDVPRLQSRPEEMEGIAREQHAIMQRITLHARRN